MRNKPKSPAKRRLVHFPFCTFNPNKFTPQLEVLERKAKRPANVCLNDVINYLDNCHPIDRKVIENSINRIKELSHE